MVKKLLVSIVLVVVIFSDSKNFISSWIAHSQKISACKEISMTRHPQANYKYFVKFRHSVPFPGSWAVYNKKGVVQRGSFWPAWKGVRGVCEAIKEAENGN